MRNKAKGILALVISAILGIHSTAFSQTIISIPPRARNLDLNSFIDSQNQQDRIAAERAMRQAEIDARLEQARMEERGRMDRARMEQDRRAAETQGVGTQKYVPANEQYKSYFMEHIK